MPSVSRAGMGPAILAAVIALAAFPACSRFRAAIAPAVVSVPYAGAKVSGTARVFVPPVPDDGPEEPMPLMLMLDPGGDASGIVERWRPAAERLGWILASTPAIRNGTPDDQDLLHLLAMLEAVATKYPVDRRSVVLDGLSGGACGAYLAALERPDLFRGAIVECGHMGAYRAFQGTVMPGSVFYLFTRSADFNQPATRSLAQVLKDHGETVTLKELPGGHEPMVGQDADDALAWMDARVRKGRAPGPARP